MNFHSYTLSNKRYLLARIGGFKQMKKIVSALAVPMFFLLSSFTSANKLYSPIAETNINSQTLINSGSEYGEAITTGKKQVAASVTFNYEFYKMEDSTALITKYVPGYALIYRIDIYLNNAVQYKGGVFNWFDGENPCYLQNINIDADFAGSNIKNYFQTPETISGSEWRCLEEVNAYDGAKNTTYNSIGLYTHDIHVNLFETASRLDSTSYGLSLTDLCYDYVKGKTHVFNEKLGAQTNNDIKVTNSSSITFNQRYTYGYKTYKTGYNYIDDKHAPYDYVKDSNGNIVKSKYYAGPTKSDSPFRFSFYGAMDFESDTTPTLSKLSVDVNVTYGSSVALDSFDRNIHFDF